MVVLTEEEHPIIIVCISWQCLLVNELKKYIPLCCRFPRGSWRWGGKHGGQPQPIRRRGRGLGPGRLGGGWQLQPPCLHAAVQWRWARGRGSGCFAEKDVTLSKARNRNGASVMQHFHRSPMLQLGLLPSGLFTLFCEKLWEKLRQVKCLSSMGSIVIL